MAKCKSARLEIKGRSFESHQRHCIVSLSKTLILLLDTRSAQETSQHEIVDWDINRQLEQRKSIVKFVHDSVNMAY